MYKGTYINYQQIFQQKPNKTERNEKNVERKKETKNPDNQECYTQQG